jgi:hypothetical protein
MEVTMLRMAACTTALAVAALAGCATLPPAGTPQTEADGYLTGSHIALKTPNPTAYVRSVGNKPLIEEAMRNDSLYFQAKPARLQ